MADEHPAAPAATPAITAGLLVPYQTLGPYTTLQEAVARLSRTPIGVIVDENDQPVAVVSREQVTTLLGGGKDAARAHGKMGARQQAREKREGISATHSLISLREEFPPLIAAEVGAPFSQVATQVQESGAAGVLVSDEGKRAGVLPARTILRRTAAEPPAVPAPTPEGE